jgi:hypothetical protein
MKLSDLGTVDNKGYLVLNESTLSLYFDNVNDVGFYETFTDSNGDLLIVFYDKYRKEIQPKTIKVAM